VPAYREFISLNPIQSEIRHDAAYFAFCGERPPDETFKAGQRAAQPGASQMVS
jgi:hypothetical protein